MLLVAPTEPKFLRELGRTSSIPEKWGVDFLFNSNGGWYGIQRKEVNDLVASMQDGRLAREMAQMKRLTVGMLIVEGPVRFTLDGVLMRSGYGKDIKRAAFRGILWSVQARGYAVQHTESMADTADTIGTFQAYIGKGKHRALDRRPAATSIWGNPNNRDYAAHLVMGLPGVGPELAERIIEQFDGVPFGWRITEADLKAVPGIGVKKAHTIYRALHQLGAEDEGGDL